MRVLPRIVTPVLGALVCLFSDNSNAQTISETYEGPRLLRLGIGVNTGRPTSATYNFAVGGDVRLQKDFYSNISGTLSLGYTSFFQRSGLGGGSIDLVPIKAGLKLFAMEHIYLSGEVGPAFGIDDNNNSPFGKGALLAYTPGIGMGFNNGLDVGVCYEGLSKNGSFLGQIAFRLAYGFKL